MLKKINRGGRPATGKVRSQKFMAEFSPEEREFLSRKVVALQEAGAKVSQNGLIVERVFLPGWRLELDMLREAQKGRPRKLFWTPR